MKTIFTHLLNNDFINADALFDKHLIEYYDKEKELYKKMGYLTTTYCYLSNDFIEVFKPTFINLLSYCHYINNNPHERYVLSIGKTNPSLHNVYLLQDLLYIDGRLCPEEFPSEITTYKLFEIALSLTHTYFSNNKLEYRNIF